jgi:hypothetical protein
VTPEERKAYERERKRRWREHNRERSLEINRRWKAENQDRARQATRQWYEENRETALAKMREDSRRRYAAEPDLYRERTRRWKADNPERARDYCRARRATPRGRVEKAIRAAASRMVGRGAAKRAGAVELLGCTVEEARAYIEARFEPGMSWANHGAWHIDHVRPIASFDLSDPEQVRACAHFTNLQPLWAEENLSKGARYGARDGAGEGGSTPSP